MGLMLLNRFTVILFLLISASLLSTSLAGRPSEFADRLGNEADSSADEDMSTKPLHQEDQMEIISERLLRDNNRDYGRYDPTPALVKPPFKLIPN